MDKAKKNIAARNLAWRLFDDAGPESTSPFDTFSKYEKFRDRYYALTGMLSQSDESGALAVNFTQSDRPEIGIEIRC